MKHLKLTMENKATAQERQKVVFFAQNGTSQRSVYNRKML